MNVFDIVPALLLGARAIPMDDNSLSMLVMLAGIAGGVMVTGYYKQLKAKAVKADRKQDLPRKRD
jgi:hypothetical protein